jgi:hypothetical protein
MENTKLLTHLPACGSTEVWDVPVLQPENDDPVELLTFAEVASQ